jgi:hypothetical protein
MTQDLLQNATYLENHQMWTIRREVSNHHPELHDIGKLHLDCKHIGRLWILAPVLINYSFNFCIKIVENCQNCQLRKMRLNIVLFQVYCLSCPIGPQHDAPSHIWCEAHMLWRWDSQLRTPGHLVKQINELIDGFHVVYNPFPQSWGLSLYHSCKQSHYMPAQSE